METPKEIYVPIVDMGIEMGGEKLAPIWWNRDKTNEKNDCTGVIKYVLANISELTWEDMSEIDEITHDVRFDYRNQTISSEDYYKEVLKRFNENKNV